MRRFFTFLIVVFSLTTILPNFISKSILADVGPKKQVVIKLTLDNQPWPIPSLENPYTPSHLLPEIIYCKRIGTDDNSNKVSNIFLPLLPKIPNCNYVSESSSPVNLPDTNSTPIKYFVSEHYMWSLPDTFLIGVLIDSTGYDGNDEYKAYISDWNKLTNQMNYEYEMDINLKTASQLQKGGLSPDNNISQITDKKSTTLKENPILHKSLKSALSFITQNYHLFLISLIITIISEIVVSIIYLYIRRYPIVPVLITLTLANIISLTALWLIIFCFAINIYLMEIFVVFFEILVLKYICKLKIKDAILLGIIANLASYLIGLFLF